MAEMTQPSDVVEKRWAQLRFVLGIAVVSTSLLTTVSVLLFGSSRRRDNAKRQGL